MKILRAWFLMLLLGTLVMASAQNADDQFVKIYNTLQQADQLNDSGNTEQAYVKYIEVQRGLKRLQTTFPNWQSRVVSFRLGYVAEKLAPLEAKFKGRLPQVEAAPDPLTAAKNQAASSVQTLQLENRVRDLAEEVDRLRAEKQILEAKLREALAAQPTAADNAELNKAEDRIRSLTKEIGVLKAGLEQELSRQQGAAAGREATQKALIEANRKLASQGETLAKLTKDRDEAIEKLKRASVTSARRADDPLVKENDRLRRELAEARGTPAPEPPAPDKAALKKELQAIESKLREQVKQNEVLVSERRALQARVENLTAEVERLKKAAPDAAALAREQEAAKQARADAAKAQQEKTALEKRVAALTTELDEVRKAKPELSKDERRDRIRRLEGERDDLKRQLSGKATASANSDNERLRRQLAAIQARVDAYEMKKDPFSPEELALFQQPKPNAQPPEVRKTAKKSIRDLPPTASQLVAEAQSAFSARKYEDAEKKYQEVLRFDLENVYTLANLALVQMEQGRLEPAEANLTKALALEPKDAYSLSLLGIVKFRQTKLDEALDLLSRSVQLDAKNSETHNYLGVVLSQKGMRGPAEAAMRKAIQINPGYGEAHHNLAVIYVSQTPPFIELARWHYEKALSAGHPANPALEKYFDKRAGRSD